LVFFTTCKRIRILPNDEKVYEGDFKLYVCNKFGEVEELEFNAGSEIGKLDGYDFAVYYH